MLEGENGREGWRKESREGCLEKERNNRRKDSERRGRGERGIFVSNPASG